MNQKVNETSVVCEFAAENSIFLKPGRLSKPVRRQQSPYSVGYAKRIIHEDKPMLFIDFEGNFSKVNEFIEIGCFLTYQDHVHQFHSYIRPNINPPNRRAIKHTGITSKLTNCAPPFEDVHANLMEWLSALQKAYNFDWKLILPVSFDTWDRDQYMLHLTSRKMAIPVWLLHWCDIRKLIARKYTNGDLYQLSLKNAAQLLNMPFDHNRQHSALYDAEVCMNLGKLVYITATHFYQIPEGGINCF